MSGNRKLDLIRSCRRRAVGFAVAALALIGSANIPQPAEDEPIEAQLDRVAAYLASSDLVKAQAAEEALLRQVREQSGSESEEYADALDQLVGLRLAAGKLAGRTLDLSRQAVLARAELPGRALTLSRTLVRLGYLLHVAGELEDAKRAFEWSLELRRQHLGGAHPDTAEVLGRLADVEMDLENVERSEALLRGALEVVEEHFGLGHTGTGEALLGLGLFLFEQERYVEARDVWESAAVVYRQSDSLYQLSRTLQNLGEAHHRLGDINEAADYLEEALEIRLRSELGLEDQAGSTYAALADLWFDLGDYDRARDAYRRALMALENRYGRDPYRYAEARSRFGLLLEESGAWEEALEHQQAVLEIRRAKLTSNDPRVAKALQRLGALHLRMGAVEDASECLREALAIQLFSRSPESLELAATRVSLAELEEVEGREGAAIAELEAALSSLEPLPERHPARIEPRARLATLLRRQGQLDRARDLVLAGLEVAQQAYGDDSVQALDLRREQALIELLSGDPAAQRTALAAEDSRRRHLKATLPSVSESQAMVTTMERQPALDIALSALARLGQTASPAQVVAAWDAVIRSRALVFDTVATRHWVVAARDHPAIRQAAFDLDRMRSRLAHLTIRGHGGLPPDRYAGLLRLTRLDVARAESHLAELSRPLAEEIERQAVGYHEVRLALPERSALVAFVRYRDYSAAAVRGSEPHYMAFVQSSASQDPVALDLGAASAIEATIRQWILAVEEGLDGKAASEASFRARGRAVRDLLWDPLPSELQDSKRVFLVADGLLHLVNPPALPLDEGGYLIEAGAGFHFLTSERDLVESRLRVEQGSGILVVGGADFSSRQVITGQGRSGSPSLGVSLTRGWSLCRSFEDHHFRPLPATVQEALEIAELWRNKAEGIRLDEFPPGEIELLTGSDASESEFKRLAPGHQVIHVATHGFFLQEACSRGPESLTGVGGNRGFIQFAGREPMILSGLALAGANRRGDATPEQEDGILTPLEILGLNLSGVQWAVLSACESGRGYVRNAEGVFGLQRAFILAGVKSVIMSLWKVDDDSTRRWMTALYRHRLAGGDDTSRAVRSASLEALQQRRRDGSSTHPVFWGGFVSCGDWR